MNTALPTRPFGGTGRPVTVIGLGGGYLNQHSYDEGLATVRRALELGVTYMDTSVMYGMGASQAIIGEALQGQEPQPLLATKLGYLGMPADFRNLDILRAQLKNSLRILRRDHVDVLQVHEADWSCWWSERGRPGDIIRPDEDYDFANAPIMELLHEAKAQGLCRLIGITGNHCAEVARVLGEIEVDTCLVPYHYDLIRRDLRGCVLPLAMQKGVAMIIGGIFQGGLFLSTHPEWLDLPLPSRLTPEVKERLKSLFALQRETGLSLVNMTVRYLLADPNITVILVGAAHPHEIEESVVAAQQGPLPRDVQAAIEALGLP